MKDPIERASAIDVVKRLMGDCELSRTVQTGLHILPSAQPDVSDINDGDMISRQAAIDARRYTFGNDEFSLEAAYHDCKLVFDGITDDDSFQEADTGLILYYANEIIYALQEALEGKDTKVPTNDCISRRAAIDALDKRFDNVPMELTTEILQLRRDLRERIPSAQPEITRCKDCKHKNAYRFPPKYDERDYCEKHGKVVDVADFCSWAERREE